MTNITIEQTQEGRQTYLRLKGVGRKLKEPRFRIVWIGSNQSLGSKGWENALNLIEAPQALQGKDLLLEIEPSLVNHIAEPRPIEILVPELNLSEQFVSPLLLPVPATRVGEAPGGKVIKFEHGGWSGPPPPEEKEEEKPPPKEPETDTAEKSEKDAPVKQTPPPRPPQSRAKVLVTLLLGIAIGAAGTHVAHMQGLVPATILALWPPRQPVRPVPGVSVTGQLDRLRTEAFAPLSREFSRLSPASPKGRPAATVAKGSTNPARTFFNEGRRSDADAAEAAYWYRQSFVRACDSETVFRLGQAYFHGLGVAPDPRTGFQLLRFANALGNRDATLEIVQLLRGSSIPFAPPNYKDLYERSMQ